MFRRLAGSPLLRARDPPAPVLAHLEAGAIRELCARYPVGPQGSDALLHALDAAERA